MLRRIVANARRFTAVCWLHGLAAACADVRERLLRKLACRLMPLLNDALQASAAASREAQLQVAQSCAADAMATTRQALLTQLEQVCAGLAQAHSERAARSSADANARVGALADQLSRLQNIVRSLDHSMEWLAELHGRGPALPGERSLPAPGPLVSIILPTWNRADRLPAALASVLGQTYANWELLLVDDGSTDDTPHVARCYAQDARIRYLPCPHRGCCAARNEALAASRGDIIAYHDSDTVWYPRYLETLVEAFAREPSLQSAYQLQLVQDDATGEAHIRGQEFDAEQLRRGNFIDLNVYAHRRELYERCGGFDPSLRRLVDWDLLLRHAEHASPRLLPSLGGRYQGGAWPRISNQESLAVALAQVQRKHERPLERPLRVLYLLHSFPQLSETYIRTEIDYMRRRGVTIEVWAAYKPAVAYPNDLPVHRGDLVQALLRAQPDLVHVHWLSMAHDQLDLLHRAGLPTTYRGHSFEFGEQDFRAVHDHPAVRRLYLFPHFARQLPPSDKVMPLPVAFAPDRFYPAAKDRRLVVRAGLAKWQKDPRAFLETAKHCPDFRFVLALCTGRHIEAMRDEVLAMARASSSPAEVVVDLDHDAAAALVRGAGIYLHTYSYEEPFGMPISIAEALASGAYVLGRAGPHIEQVLGPCGNRYEDPHHAAALVNDTLTWSDSQWNDVARQAIDWSYANFTDTIVFQRMLADWCELVPAAAARRQAA